MCNRQIKKLEQKIYSTDYQNCIMKSSKLAKRLLSLTLESQFLKTLKLINIIKTNLFSLML